MCVIVAFEQGIQISYSKETETVTLAFPEELKVDLEFTYPKILYILAYKSIRL